MVSVILGDSGFLGHLVVEKRIPERVDLVPYTTFLEVEVNLFAAQLKTSLVLMTSISQQPSKVLRRLSVGLETFLKKESLKI